MTELAPALEGAHILGSTRSRAGVSAFTACDPRTGAALAPAFHEATDVEVARAMELAASAHPAFEAQGRELRAQLLEAIAAGLEALGAALVERASAETGLPTARIEAERGRTTGQLRLFARTVREGAYLGARIDHGDPARAPLPKPDLRSMARALGPVVVFGASNFPLAFSVAGGDTAAALAAGCPVVVKGHPNHPGTSELVGGVIAGAVRALGLPEGTFSLVQGRTHEVGLALVLHPAARAVAFTGSLRGGRALFDAAQAREVPIPVFAEMGSVNPVFLLPGRVAADPAALGAQIAGSVTMGVGQFCTNPGVLVLVRDAASGALLDALAAALAAAPEAPLLHAGIRKAFDAGLERLAGVTGVEVRARAAAAGPCGARGALLTIPAARFLAEHAAREEVFGPSTLAVLCEDAAELLAVARGLAGQLTATLHAGAGDESLAASLAPLLAERAGRVLFGGFPTGVEVTEAMVHGGPYPATTDSRTTSVGPTAIARFVRPVAYQNFPQPLLPDELRDDGPAGLWRRVDGAWQLTPGA
ncbi:MAG: aldehyde dehydrogenase (NADP(+)) [Planctomycetota bacterium]